MVRPKEACCVTPSPQLGGSHGGQLGGRTALVTGAAHGIGLAYARGLAHEGARVVMADIDTPGLATAMKQLSDEGLEVVDAAVDVADPESVKRCREAVERRVARVDILVNNAAVFATVPMSRAGYQELSVDEWDLMMAVNLRGAWLMARAFVPAMQARGYGKVINISSGTALKGSASRIHYVTSKAGIIGFTKTLAREVGGDGVGVNCIAPGSTLSEAELDDDVVALRTSAVASRAIQRVQLPDDLVGTVVFFASSASDFITGQTLVVDGGACMH
ncbi:MAG: SDR family oxidoreductase [Nitriliruptorales bacterium]|nr:SDR family oxidoreductase [Nitriliruptorales bacterium]